MIQAAKYKAYAGLVRFDKPIGTYLLMWPCWWALAIASHGWPDPVLLFLFALGAFVMRSAGCILNDMADRKLDAKVERTRDRPLASGTLTMADAISLLALLLSIALGIVIYLDNIVLFYFAIFALAMVAAYPFMKRITWWPQLFLGLTFNLGALFAWITVTGEFSPAVFALYIGCVFWTLGYDTIYGYQDIEDDLRVGIKSSSIRVKSQPRRFVSLCYGLTLVGWSTALWLHDASVIAYIGIFVCGAHLLWQVKYLDITQACICLKLFKSNTYIGITLFCFLLVANLSITRAL